MAYQGRGDQHMYNGSARHDPRGYGGGRGGGPPPPQNYGQPQPHEHPHGGYGYADYGHNNYNPPPRDFDQGYTDQYADPTYSRGQPPPSQPQQPQQPQPDYRDAQDSGMGTRPPPNTRGGAGYPPRGARGAVVTGSRPTHERMGARPQPQTNHSDPSCKFPRERRD